MLFFTSVAMGITAVLFLIIGADVADNSYNEQ